jgi:filamentous hemagglutinin
MSQRPPQPQRRHRFLFNLRRSRLQLACLMAACAGWPVTVMPQTVATRIVIDPSAPRAQRPTVLRAPNGVPVVNIQTPSAAGVSRNRYRQFDVGPQGVILNNSRTDVQTQLGGWVQANPWQAGGGARVILNEVQSSDPSLMHGPLEVAGPRAEVVLANPSGISVNGSSFINASRVTLTTGVAMMNGDVLTGYQVQDGTVRIEGAGLDARAADYTAILARAVEINAGLWARHLQVVTGTYAIAHDSGAAEARPQATAPDPAAPVPAFSLDVSRLGGLYAGRITLVGTEAGLGVRNAGDILAGAGPLVISQEGWLSNSGRMQAQGGDVSVRVRGDLTQSGTVYGQQQVQWSSQGSQTHSGTVAALGDLQIEATGPGASIRANDGTVWAAGLTPEEGPAGAQALRVQAEGSVQLAGGAQAWASDTLTVRARDLGNATGGSLTAGRAIELQVEGTFTNRGLVDGADTRIRAGVVDNVGTGRIYGDHLAIEAGHLSNREETQAGVTRSATLAGRERVDLGVRSLSNGPDAYIFSGGDMALGGQLDAEGRATGSAQTLTNTGGTIESAGSLRIEAQRMVNANAGLQIEQREVSRHTLTEYAHSPGDVVRGGDPGLRFSPDDIRVEPCESMCLISPTGSSDAYRRYDFTRTVSETVVTGTRPGKLLSGGDMILNIQEATNDHSQIVAGGALNVTGSQVNNVDRTGVRVTTEQGTVMSSWRRRRKGHDTYDTQTDPYTPAPRIETLALNLARMEAFGDTASPGMPRIPRADGSPAPDLRVPQGSLFRQNPDPQARYVIETDPRFTQHRLWLGSDYLLQALALDPAVTQKRLGDGFLEQRWIREQVLALTGQRFLGDFTSDEQAYRALMDAGATVARAWNLRPGIALSPAQVAQLTSDIVWLVSKEVNLPDGTRQAVLVPQVYLRVRPGDVDGTGALLAGRTLNLELSADAVNSGTVAGRDLLRIEADHIRNLGGRLRADTLALRAEQDIDNRGGQIQAQSAAALFAGRDILLDTTTASSERKVGSSQFATTHIDQVAGLSVTGPSGVLVAEAGRDLNLNAAQVRNAGSGATVLQAGRDVNLGVVTTQERQDLQQDSRNFLRQSSSRDVGTEIAVGGLLTIQAGRDATLQAADVTAGGAAAVVAGRNVYLAAGQETQTIDAASHRTSGGAWSRRTVTTRDQSRDVTAVTSRIAGQQVQVLGQNVISEGAKFESQGLLHVEGSDKTLLYEVQSVRQRESQHEARSSTFGITTRRSESKDSHLQTQSLDTRLQSDEAIRVGVGSVADLRGATVSAPQIGFVRSQGADASQPGQLLLGASTDLAQDSHSERTVTAGVWQAQSGRGSATQTARQTQLHGQVSIDPALQVSVALGLQPGQTAAQTVEALSQQPGLSYLRDLQSDPKVNWQAIELAREHWSYSQQGLTPAGAALLSVAIAAATGGAGSSLAGAASGSTMGAAANAGFSALTAQAGVALVNHGGDVGKALEALGSSDTVKNIMVAMLTAGVGSNVAGQGGSAVAAQTATGCVSGVITGAGCEQGARTAALLSSAGEVYQSLVGYPANPGPGENRHGTDDLGKSTGNGTYAPVGYSRNPEHAFESVATSSAGGGAPNGPAFVPGQDRGPGFGQQRPSDFGMNVIGLNRADGLFSQGGSVSRVLNRIPFVNATAGLHDLIFNRAPDLNFALWNLPSMAPAALLSIPAGLNHPDLVWIPQIKHRQQKAEGLQPLRSVSKGLTPDERTPLTLPPLIFGTHK